MIPAFLSGPALSLSSPSPNLPLKRPRNSLSTPTCAQTPPSSSSSSSPSTPPDLLARKVQNHLLAVEQQSDLSSATPHPPPPLRVQLDLLTYRARTLTRGHAADPPEAERLYRRCIALNSADGRAWLGLARLKISAGHISAARRIFRRAVSASRRNPYLLQAWGVLEEKQGSYQRARGLYEAAIRADDTHCASWVALGLWYQRHSRDLSQARSAFKHGAEADPTNYYVWHVWGVLEKSAQNYRAARACFRRGVQANPKNAATYVIWGCLEHMLGNSAKATSLFTKAHKANPRNTHAYISHAVAAERDGDTPKAVALLSRAIAVRPKDPAPHQTYALLRYRTGDVEAARTHLRDALRIDKRHGPSWHAWARIEADLGDVTRARQLFQEAIWAAPKSSHAVRTWHSWASLEAAEGHVRQARLFFAHGLDIDPSSIPILASLAKLEAADGNMPRARHLLEETIKLQPTLRYAWALYEKLERDFGSCKRAQLVFERWVVASNQVDERFTVSHPLPGDYATTGMWIDALELSPTESALSVVEVDPDIQVNLVSKVPFGGKSNENVNGDTKPSARRDEGIQSKLAVSRRFARQKPPSASQRSSSIKGGKASTRLKPKPAERGRSRSADAFLQAPGIPPKIPPGMPPTLPFAASMLFGVVTASMTIL